MSKVAPGIPRNAVEWGNVFRAADIISRAQAVGHPPNRGLRIETGTWVVTKPGGNRRDDAAIADRETIARVANIADGAMGKMVKLHWYFKKSELRDGDLMTSLTSEVASTMGERELLSYSGDTFDFVDTVHHLIAVVSFEPHKFGLCTVDEETWYTRTNLSLTLGLNTTQYSLLEGSFRPICTTSCQHRGHYSPAVDTVRYCEGCERWFHVECLAETDQDRPTLQDPAPDRPKQCDNEEDIEALHETGDIEYSAIDYALWRKLMRLPIQRGYKGHEYPLSFECLLVELRKIDNSEGCPADVRDVVASSLSMASHIQHKANKYLDLFYNLLITPTFYYRCPLCSGDKTEMVI